MTDQLAPPLPDAAHVIADDAEALAVARRFAAEIAPGAAERDRVRAIPRAELAALARTGLLGITVPRAHGGADVSTETLVEVVRILAAADPSIAQVPQNHFVFVQVLRDSGTGDQRARFFAEILRGARLGNALSERGTRHVMELRTRLTRSPDGEGWRLNGRKYYCTGALTAQWIPVMTTAEDDLLRVAYVPRDADGVEVLEDWTAMGQRSTWSGTTILTDVRVPDEDVVDLWPAYEHPQVGGAFGQILHVAIDAGIGEAALHDAAAYVRERTRPWFESGVERAADEPHLILRFGQLSTRLHAAEELLRKAARTLDAAVRDGVTAASAAATSLAVAEAKAFTGEVAVELGSELFELAGTSATDERHGLDRHWRNARTHTLHDPARWKYHHAGNYVLNGVLPPNHGLL
jgi:SfnB family sulfur acquisition oxidoreductase